MTKRHEDSSYNLLITEIERAVHDANTLAKIKRVLRSLSGHRVYIPGRRVEKEERIDLAYRLLSEGRPRSDVRRYLATRFAIRERTATEVINAALKIGPLQRTKRKQ